MDAIAALHQRVSTPRLTAPAPTPHQLSPMFKAALRAADHGNMQPWRFLIVEGVGLTRLGELFANIKALGPTRRTWRAAGEGVAPAAPAMLVEGFNFSSKSSGI